MGLASDRYGPGDVMLTEEDVRRALGSKAESFLSIMRLAESIMENPGNYPGVKASKTALQLAAARVDIGLMCQKAKLNSKGEDRLRKDILFTMYHSLEELINCLKLHSKFEMDASR